jgi:anti-sigma regulatory factor (Ser/Thr protein kinase)
VINWSQVTDLTGRTSPIVAGMTGMRVNGMQLVNGIRPGSDGDGADEVIVRVPALRRYVGSVRSMTTALAAQGGLTVDDIEDLQMSVDEACSILINHVSAPAAWLELHFLIGPGDSGQFGADVRINAPATTTVDRSSLPWTVLSALTDELTLAEDTDELSISFAKHRRASRP